MKSLRLCFFSDSKKFRIEIFIYFRDNSTCSLSLSPSRYRQLLINVLRYKKVFFREIVSRFMSIHFIPLEHIVFTARMLYGSLSCFVLSNLFCEIQRIFRTGKIVKSWNFSHALRWWEGGNRVSCFELEWEIKGRSGKAFHPFPIFPHSPIRLENLGRFREIKQKSRTRKQLSELVWRPHNTIPGWLFSLTSFRVFVSCLML